MDWFKFYGKDWLTDIKIIQMRTEDRLCFITLLCLASSDADGIIKNCDEDAIINLTHLRDNPCDDNNEYANAGGFLQRLSDNEMITIDNNGNVTIINFVKRQSRALTGYERIKRHREKQRELENKGQNDDDNEMITDDNALDNTREDKIREDKIRREKKNTVFSHWNSKKIIIHQKMTGDMKKEIDKALKDYSEEQILEAINVFDTVLKGKEYFWSYKWGLYEFMKRGLKKFVDKKAEDYLSNSKGRETTEAIML